ncbi:MAG: PilZ domain-containing protein, partial [bacterium]|nr:PilZ domain-containing protein [bacterium]
LDAEVEVVIELPGDEKPVKVSGRIARLAQRKDDSPGFAVEFDNLEEPARARIAALVDDALADLGWPSA